MIEALTVRFPVSGVEVFVLVPPAVAFVVSFFTSMGGVSGAFLLLPFQMSALGFTTPSVSATNQLFNVVAIPSGLRRYAAEGRLVWPLTLAVVIGTLPGVLAGTVIRVRFLPDPAAFKAFAGLVLLYIGARLLRDLLRPGGGKGSAAEAAFRARIADLRSGEAAVEAAAPRAESARPGRLVFEFAGTRFECSTLGIVGLSLVVGVVGGVYGIGGGSIMAPFFVGVLGLPVYAVAGAALAGTFVTSVAAVAFYQAIAPLYPELAVAPDWALGLLFGLGGAAGMWLGARCQKHVPARVIKTMLVIVILIVAARYLAGLLA